MQRSVRLSLKKETLSTLTGDDLGAVRGGVPLPDHTIEVRCWVEFSPSFTAPTQCCEGIPTFHRAVC